MSTPFTCPPPPLPPSPPFPPITLTNARLFSCRLIPSPSRKPGMAGMRRPASWDTSLSSYKTAGTVRRLRRDAWAGTATAAGHAASFFQTFFYTTNEKEMVLMQAARGWKRREGDVGEKSSRRQGRGRIGGVDGGRRGYRQVKGPALGLRGSAKYARVTLPALGARKSPVRSFLRVVEALQVIAHRSLASPSFVFMCEMRVPLFSRNRIFTRDPDDRYYKCHSTTDMGRPHRSIVTRLAFRQKSKLRKFLFGPMESKDETHFAPI
jgi:hypothetical protein